jgi:cell division protein FtsI (penicillin-binding protein 3)
VLNSKTGEVLALAGYPGFDPNQFSKSSRDSYRCRAVTDTYEVGSTIKPLVAAAAIAEGLTNASNEVFCENGSWRIRGRTLHDHKPFGKLTVSGIIEQSSNIGIAKVASLLGPEMLHGYLAAFGIGRSTHVGLLGEEEGILHPWPEWSQSTMVSVPMGHEVGVTPMQLATAFNCLASGGVHVSPRILLRVTGSTGASTHRFQPMQTARVFKQDMIEKVMDPMLRRVITQGTGKRAAVQGIAVAGKTGTAQKIDPKTRTYSHSKHVVSFAGYAPANRAEEDPKITVMVLVDEPTLNVGGGGRVAAPVFRQIVKRILASGRMP